MNWAKINTNNQHTVIKIAYNREITIFNVEFNGIEEIKEYALKGVAKDGVYVAEDSQIHPCFDSSDFAYENRSFWNFIFARNREELERKIKILKSIHYKDNYKKLTGKLAPMAYWEGDPYYSIEIIYE